MDTDTRRRCLARHLYGDGIEIGALHNPLDISGLRVTRVRYVDRYDVAGLREQYPSLADLPLVPVDIVDDGEVLSTIPDCSLDFIIANHMIEHTSDPIGTLRRWLAKLRPGGVIYFAMPDKRVGWDEHRPVTPIAHLVADYQSDSAARKLRDRAHFVEWYDLVNREIVDSDDEIVDQPDCSTASAEEQRLAAIDHLIAIDYSIHYHVFTYHTFLALLKYLNEVLHFPFAVVEAAAPVPESWECIFILRRTDAPIPPVDAPIALPPPELSDADAIPPAEADRAALARLMIRMSSMESRIWRAKTRAWEADTRAWHAEQRLAEAEQRVAEMESALVQAQERLQWLEGDVIPAKDRQLGIYEAAMRRIEMLPPIRVMRRVQRLIKGT